MRQFLVTVTPVLVPSTASTTTAAPVVSPVVGPVVGKIHILRTSEVAPDSMERLPPIGSNNLSVHDYEDPVPELVGILQKMGVNTAGMTFELYDDVIENLGGHYTNHLIRADLGNGKKEDFSVEWTLRNPKVTAVEIARLSKMSSAQG